MKPLSVLRMMFGMMKVAMLLMGAKMRRGLGVQLPIPKFLTKVA